MYRSLLDKGVIEGILNLHFPSGERYRFGQGGREASWVVEDEDIIRRIARNWEFQLGQTYMEGGCRLRTARSALHSTRQFCQLQRTAPAETPGLVGATVEPSYG